MVILSLDSLQYRIFSDTEANIESLNNNSVAAVFIRNSIAFSGTRVRIAHLRAPVDIKTIVIPYSVHTIFCPSDGGAHELKSLVFEFGSDLRSIAASSFRRSKFESVFLPRSIRFIGSSAFDMCESVSRVYFDCHSSVWQLNSSAFSGLIYLIAVTIPVSVRQIHESAFNCCKHLRSVTFEFPSSCWYLASAAFRYCGQLESIFLPPSVEVIAPIISSYTCHIPR
jgi:hypothetical protein